MNQVIVREIVAKSLLRKQKKVDSWFLSGYGMNLYRGCAHNCAYCDGRAEGYYVEGEFGREISVKINAVDLLERELDPDRKRKPLKKGIIVLGGGVGDSYQEAERKYRISRGILQVIRKYGYPVHILTKSAYVLDDLDLLKEMNKEAGVLVSFSFSSVDDSLSGKFEPFASRPSERLKAIETFRQEGIISGMFLMPVIPFITDTLAIIDQSLDAARQYGARYALFAGMTLKQGRQEDYFYSVLREWYPGLEGRYRQIYTGDQWGNADREYYHSIHRTYREVGSKYRLPGRIPLHFVRNWLSEQDQLIILFDQIHYLLKLGGQKSFFGLAARRLHEQELSSTDDILQSVEGFGADLGKLARIWFETGRCTYYEKLLID